MSEYICKIADLDEIIKKWDYEISIHPYDENWITWKNKSIEGYHDNNQLCYIGVLGGEMPKTIVETILNPKYQQEYNFKNLAYKVELCEKLKHLEAGITAQLDREHKRMFAEYAECWVRLHTELSLYTFASGMKLAEIHN